MQAYHSAQTEHRLPLCLSGARLPGLSGSRFGWRRFLAWRKLIKGITTTTTTPRPALHVVPAYSGLHQNLAGSVKLLCAVSEMHSVDTAVEGQWLNVVWILDQWVFGRHSNAFRSGSGTSSSLRPLMSILDIVWFLNCSLCGPMQRCPHVDMAHGESQSLSHLSSVDVSFFILTT